MYAMIPIFMQGQWRLSVIKICRKFKINIHLIIIFLLLTGCQSAPSQKNQKPPRPNSAAALCMENAISSLKKARLAFNDGRTNGEKCFWTRELLKRSSPNLTFKNECPNDNGPIAYDSYKSHVFALKSIDLNSCPANFSENFNGYIGAWQGLEKIAASAKNLHLRDFNSIFNRDIPSNGFEEVVLNQQKLLRKYQPNLWIIYQKDTGWCHDPSDNKDIIYWQRCPVYKY